jgi:hypothetical protein
MTTPEIRRSQIKGFERLQKELGGICPSLLPEGCKVYVETREYIYFLEAFDSDEGRCYTLESASPQGSLGDVIAINAHYTILKHDMENWIGKGMRMVLKFASGGSVMVGEVTGVTVEGTSQNGETYTFDLWRDDD